MRQSGLDSNVLGSTTNSKKFESAIGVPSHCGTRRWSLRHTDRWRVGGGGFPDCFVCCGTGQPGDRAHRVIESEVIRAITW